MNIYLIFFLRNTDIPLKKIASTFVPSAVTPSSSTASSSQKQASNSFFSFAFSLFGSSSSKRKRDQSSGDHYTGSIEKRIIGMQHEEYCLPLDAPLLVFGELRLADADEAEGPIVLRPRSRHLRKHPFIVTQKSRQHALNIAARDADAWRFNATLLTGIGIVISIGEIIAPLIREENFSK